MNQVNYTAMSTQELRQYFLEHRQDQAALQAYLERRRQQPAKVITTVDDPEFDDKIQTAIRQQMTDNQS